MIAEIAENRPNEFISIRHLGFVIYKYPSPTGEDRNRSRFRCGLRKLSEIHREY